MNTNTSEKDNITGRIIGCAMKVHSNLGFGFVESVYENSLVIELRNHGFNVQQQVPIKVYYQGFVVGDFVADLIVDNQFILELKAVQMLNSLHEVQLVNYLNGTGKDIGLLMNFGAKSLEFKKKF